MIRDEVFEAVKQLELVAKRDVDNQLAGEYESAFKGRGMDFVDVREYQPGDDIRVIDWNVSARLNELYIKQFAEERQLTVFLCVDISGSQAFGTKAHTKRHVAAELAAIIAFTAVSNNDRVGLILFTDETELFIPPSQGRKHVMRMLTNLLDHEPDSKQTDIGAALKYLSNITSRRTMTFMLSDFVDTGYEKNLRTVTRRHELIPVLIEDPLEKALPNMGVVDFKDPETGELVSFDTQSERCRKAFEKMRQSKFEETLTRFRKYGLEPLRIETDGNHIQPFLKHFKQRAQR